LQKNIFYWSNKQFQSWLKTPQENPSPFPLNAPDQDFPATGDTVSRCSTKQLLIEEKSTERDKRMVPLLLLFISYKTSGCQMKNILHDNKMICFLTTQMSYPTSPISCLVIIQGSISRDL
jgi:hypothetical protein